MTFSILLSIFSFLSPTLCSLFLPDCLYVFLSVFLCPSVKASCCCRLFQCSTAKAHKHNSSSSSSSSSSGSSSYAGRCNDENRGNFIVESSSFLSPGIAPFSKLSFHTQKKLHLLYRSRLVSSFYREFFVSFHHFSKASKAFQVSNSLTQTHGK